MVILKFSFSMANGELLKTFGRKDESVQGKIIVRITAKRSIYIIIV